MEGLKPFALWGVISLLVGGLVYLVQMQGWLPMSFPYWAAGILAVLVLGFMNLLARGPK